MMEKLTQLFNHLISLSFWSRLIHWGKVRTQLHNAFEQLQALKGAQESNEKFISNLMAEKASLVQDVRRVEELLDQSKESNHDLKSKVTILEERLDVRNQQISQLKSDVHKHETIEEERERKLQSELDKMLQSRESFENDRIQLAEEQLREKEAYFAKMKKQWATHEAAVEQDIKVLCDKHMIKYFEEVPFHGRPDNAIEICDEMIIFDAKSPANEDLTNFPKYILSQAESAKKYAAKENVRKDIYLVVPSSTAEVIKQWTYYLGDYTVYIITRDALEPVILSLKRLEDYEFVDQLSPDERETIVRLIAKFAHNTKRRIQIDQFFADQFLDLLHKCESELPKEFLEQVVAYEKREKLNPPVEKRAKMISTGELQEKHLKTNAEAGIRKVEIPENLEAARKVI